MPNGLNFQADQHSPCFGCRNWRICSEQKSKSQSPNAHCDHHIPVGLVEDLEKIVAYAKLNGDARIKSFIEQFDLEPRRC
jgi:hypothetical protein